MRIIGLTGGIACGKSNISDKLASLGCVIIDGDKLSRELTVPGGAALPALYQSFGQSVFRADGNLNRRALANLVFSDPEAMKTLDAIMQPMLADLIVSRIEEAKGRGAQFCVLDMPLLYEKGLDRLCDTVWCVWLPPRLQMERLMSRDGLNVAQAEARIRSQMPVNEKAARANVVISTEGTIEETRARIPTLLEKERSMDVKRQTIPVSRAVNRPDGGIERTTPRVASPVPKRSASVPVSERTGQSAFNDHIEIRKNEWKMPSSIVTALVLAFFILLGMFTATSLMKAYLKQQADAREAAYQRVVDHHPLVYREAIEQSAAEFNLEPAFVSAIIMNESSFRPTAESSVGARGMMQLMPDTAEWIAHKLKVDSYSFERMFDPESNIRFGCWYLNYLSGLFRGDPYCVTAAYHAGQGQVTAWLSDPGRSPDGITLNMEGFPDGPTKSYVGRVTQDYGIYQALYFEEDPVPADSDAAFVDGAPN